ncbi:MAG: cysteine desulfurase family protein [Candidatus Pacebacteria bacterium]|nr:cysteine desulfurase family protein [Candidatus Paceibacterota bacterium]
MYLDYAATCPVDKRVLKEMLPFFSEKYGNTGSLHSFGQEAKIALEKARERIADLIFAQTEEIIFTSSATESNNLILKGLLKKNDHLIISCIEHPCIKETAKFLKTKGVLVTELKIDKQGFVKDLEKSIKKNTALISIIHASNEIGVVQDIEKISKVAKRNKILFHTDAAQSFGKIPINVKNIDFLTASSHKIYGPKGAALLYIKKGLKINPLLHGGGQEQGLRSSTVNIPAIVGFGKAAEIAKKEIQEDYKKQIKLRNKIITQALKIKACYLNGDQNKRLANNINLRFSNIEGEALTMKLDLEGIAVSTGSACASTKLEPSYVLLALGLKPQEAHGSLRISLGKYTREQEIDYFLKILSQSVKELRKLSPFK